VRVDVRRLTSNHGSDVSPAWSPDGTRLLFASDQNLPASGADEIYSVAPDGSCLTWITNGTTWSVQPGFRPHSGDTFDPGSCNPADHPLRPEFPNPKPFAGGLWLGPRFNGLLASDVYPPDELDYADCEHFEAKRCPPTIGLSEQPACDTQSWDAIIDLAPTLTRRRGAVLAYYDRVDPAELLSGAAITSIAIGDHGTQNTRAHVTSVADALRPYTATHPTSLAAPRVPRTLARRFDHTARVVQQLGQTAAAKRLKLHHRTVAVHLRLRALLRPYRLCDS
jgi:WD40-like Beta Propeller Repeat